MKLVKGETNYRARLFYAEEIDEKAKKDRWIFTSSDGKVEFGAYPFEPDTVLQEIINFYNIQVNPSEADGKLNKINNLKVKITKPTKDEIAWLDRLNKTASSVIEYWGTDEKDVSIKYQLNIREWAQGKYTLVDTRCTNFLGNDNDCEKGLKKFITL